MTLPKLVPSPVNASTFRGMYDAVSIPAWLQGPTSARYQYLKGAYLDALADSTAWSVAAKWPEGGIPNSLPLIGYNRQITRGLTEPDAAFAKRLKRWRTDWKYAGSAQSLLRQVQAMFSPSAPVCRVVWSPGDDLGPPAYSIWYTIDGNGDITRYDTRTSVSPLSPFYWGVDGAGPGGHYNYWWRFWVIIYVDILATPANRPSVRSVVERWTRAGATNTAPGVSQYSGMIISTTNTSLFTPTNATATAGNYWNPASRTGAALYW